MEVKCRLCRETSSGCDNVFCRKDGIGMSKVSVQADRRLQSDNVPYAWKNWRSLWQDYGDAPVVRWRGLTLSTRDAWDPLPGICCLLQRGTNGFVEKICREKGGVRKGEKG